MRTVREDSAAYDAVEDARERWDRADDAWETIKWVLARDPESFSKPVTESGMTRSFTFDGARSIGMPTVVVIYDFDPQYVTIREARFTDAKAISSGRA